MRDKRITEIVLGEKNVPEVDLKCVAGPSDLWFDTITKHFDVFIEMTHPKITISSTDRGPAKLAKAVILEIIFKIASNGEISLEDVKQFISVAENREHKYGQLTETTVRGKPLKIVTQEQEQYWRNMSDKDIVVCDGPAGTGKTFLAIARALKGLEDGEFDKIIITRPAVETGVKLGSLPGGEMEKIEPFLRPIFDNISYFISDQKVLEKLVEDGQLELCHTGYMRGRNLRNTVMIVDEGQNSEIDEGKMLVTRIGDGSKVFYCGDRTQCDLKGKNNASALPYLFMCLEHKNLKHIGTNRLTEASCVRHEAVKEVLANLT